MNKSFYSSIQPRGFVFFFLSIPLGIIQGFNEVLFGFALLYFLSHFGLTSAFVMPAWFPQDMFHPVWFLVLVGFLRWLTQFSANVVTNLCYENFFTNVRSRLAASMNLPASVRRLSIAELSNIFSNLLPKSASLVLSAADIITRLFVLCVTLWGLFHISLNLTFVSLLAIAVLIVPVLISRKFFQSYSAAIYGNTKRFTERFMHDMRNLDFLRIIGKTSDESSLLQHVSSSIYKTYLRYISWLTASTTWPQFAAVGVIVFVVITNTKQSLVPSVSLIPFIYLLSRLTSNMGDVMRAAGTAEFNWPFAKNLAQVLEQLEHSEKTSATVPVPSSPVPAIESLSVKQLAIGREQRLLDGITFSAKSGDLVLIGGPSGRGKTTLLMTLIGLVPLLDGEILWNGEKRQASPQFLSQVAYSGADPFLLDATVRENILLGNEANPISDDELWAVLKLCQCDFIETIPGKLDFKLAEGGEGISTGQKQRLSLARAVLRKPNILLLDEATSNIDMDTEKVIIQNIRRTLPQTMVFAVSHRRSLEDVATIHFNL